MTTRPLLTDEEVKQGSEGFCPSLPDMPLAGERRDVQQSFRSGARFARAIYEIDREKLLARIAELEGMNDGADLFMDSTTGADEQWVVPQSSIRSKIAALRKELGE